MNKFQQALDSIKELSEEAGEVPNLTEEDLYDLKADDDLDLRRLRDHYLQ